MEDSKVSRPARALFYSHDTVGLGHLRRTLLICDGLATRFHRNLATLVVTGSPMAHGFRIPPSVDYVKLPSVAKIDNEQYESRFLDVSFQDIFRLREEIIFRTAVTYQPDFVFVDNVPLGMKGEIRKALEFIRRNFRKTAIILSLRDILDESSTVVPLWRQQGVFEAIEKYYDRICIYGQPLVFDPITEYAWPESLRGKACFCGYLPRAVDKNASHAIRSKYAGAGEKLVFVSVGGGGDGAPVIDAYLRSLPMVTRNAGVRSVILLGPDMEQGHAARFTAECAADPRITVMDFCDDPLPYLDAADLVVSMGGYNTVSEILALRKRAIVVPRVHPRKEQLIRAQRLESLGMLRMIHPAELTPDRLARQILAELHSHAKPPEKRLEFTGIDRLAGELASLLGSGARPACAAQGM